MIVYCCTVHFIICHIKQEEQHAKWHSGSKNGKKMFFWGGKEYDSSWTKIQGWHILYNRKCCNKNIDKNQRGCIYVHTTSQLLNWRMKIMVHFLGSGSICVSVFNLLSSTCIAYFKVWRFFLSVTMHIKQVESESMWSSLISSVSLKNI